MRYWLVIAIGVGFLFSIFSYSYAQESIPSPLKQIRSGVLPQDVKCNEGFVLIIKVNGEPICVKPTSVSRLLSYGWITLEKFETIHPTILQQNETNIVSNQIAADNVTGPNDLASGTSNATGSTIQLSTGITTPTISATQPDIKIISIEMSPDPLKVGDKPQFNVTYQNISDKKIVHMDAPCPVFTYTVYPPDSVSQSRKVGDRGCESMGRDVIFYFIKPSQIVTDNVYPLSTAGSFTIIKAGVLTVTMQLPISVDNGDRYTETVQFNVNAIDNATTTKQVSINNTKFTNVVQNQNLPVSYSDCTNENAGRFPRIIPPDNVTSPIYLRSVVPLPPFIVNPTVSSTEPGIVKILEIGMCPLYPKVGDKVHFTVIYQNISDKPLFHNEWHSCCQFFGFTISPQDSVDDNIYTGKGPLPADWVGYVPPNQIVVDPGKGLVSINDDIKMMYYGPYGEYKITKPGMLTVTLQLGWPIESHEFFDTIKFDVNATQ